MHLLKVLLPLFLAAAFSSSVQAQRWRFVACGDGRGASSSAPVNTQIMGEIVKAITNEHPAFVLFTGDLVYSGSASAFQVWTNTMAPVYRAGIKVYPIMGNHDANAAAAYTNIFGRTLPANGPSGELFRTYSFTYSNALVLALDEEVVEGKVNQSWINQVLATNQMPHVFALGHMSAFKVTDDHTSMAEAYSAGARDTFWNSLSNAGARMYFCGHYHFYNHTRMDDGDGNSTNDLHQFVVGTAGAPLMTSTPNYDGINDRWTPRKVFHEAQYGYAVVDVDGPTVTITWKHRSGAGKYSATSDVFTYTVPPRLPPGPFVWDGGAGSSQWSADGGRNWVIDLPPTNGAALTFAGTTRQTNTNDLSVASVGLITFQNGGFKVRGNALTLNAGITNTGTNAWEIKSTLKSAQTFVSGSGLLTLSGAIDLSSNLLTVAGAGDHVISGAVSGGGGVAKQGTGTLRMSGVNTYTGDTTVSAGTQVIDGSLAGAVLVKSNAVLSGSGSMGSLTISNGAVVAPGSGSPGRLTVQGDFKCSGNYACQVNGSMAGTNYDQIRVTGNVTLGGALTVTPAAGFTPNPATDRFWIVVSDGTAPVSGRFSNYTNGAVVFTAGAAAWTIRYGANYATGSLSGGNDVVLASIPPPAIGALVFNRTNFTFHFTNLTPSVTNVVERANSLPATNWYPVFQFVSPTGSFDWTLPLTNTPGQAFFRLRVER